MFPLILPNLTPGALYDGTSVEISHSKLGSISGVQSVDFSFGMEFSKVKGTGQWDQGYTPGRYVAGDLTLDLWASEFNDMVVKSGGDSAFYAKQFDLTITLFSPLFQVPLKKIILVGCRPSNAATNFNTDSTDIQTVSLTCQVLKVSESGLLEANIGQVLSVVRQLL